MADSTDLNLRRVQPVGDAAPVQPVRNERLAGTNGGRTTAPHGHEVAAVTGGNLSAAYAQFVVNQDTHDVVIRIREAETDRVIAEYPSRQVEEMAASMQKYADTLARRRAALNSSLGSGK
jgi:hypothetical protein